MTNCTAPRQTCAKSLVYKWSLQLWQPHLSTWKNVPDLHSKISTALSSPSISIKAGALDPGVKYRVTVTVTAQGVTPGVSSYELITNSPPTGGMCEVTPTEGEVLKTEFRLHCQGWKDLDQPLTYQYVYVTDPGLNSVVTYGANSDTTTKLPLGVASQDYIINIRFLIIDSLSAATEVKRIVKVKNLAAPSITRQTLTSSATSLNHMLQAGNVKSATQLANAMLATLNLTPAGTINVTEKSQIVADIIHGMTSQVQVQTLQTLSQVTSVIGRATANPQEVSLKAQNDSLNALVQLTGLLQDKSKNSDSLDDHLVYAAAENLVLSLGNIMNSASRKATLKSQQLYEGQEQSVHAAQRSVRLVDVVGGALLSRMVLGEPTSVVRTASLSMVLARQTPDELTHVTFAELSSSFTLPDDNVLMNLLKRLRHVDSQMVSAAFNPFTWDSASSLINSHVVSFILRNDQGSEIMVSGLSKYIEITMSQKNAIAGSERPDTAFLKPAKISYHRLTISRKGTALLLQINPVREVLIRLLISYNVRPTASKSDYQGLVSELPHCATRAEQQICQRDSSLVFISSTLLTNTGEYYIGLLYEQSSRKRRSCFGHGRQKRSCVEPKDLPKPENRTIVPVYDPNTDINYTMSTQQYGCMYWSGHTWAGTGCKVGSNSSAHALQCLCNHLTSFGGSLLVAPNPIDFDVVLLELTRLDESGNVAVLATMLVILLVYVVIAVLARRADRKDQKRFGSVISVTPGSTTGYPYKMVVVTGVWRNCGTTANVAIVIHGSEAVSQPIILSRNMWAPRVILASGNADEFVVSIPCSLGSIEYLDVWHDNHGPHPSWFLNQISITSLDDNSAWHFTHKDWLALEKGDGEIRKTLYPTSAVDMKTFGYSFNHHTNKKFTEDHLWLSVISKPPYSNFTRLQRATCCLCVLFSVMVVDAMFYRLDKAPDTTIRVGPLKFSWRQVMVGIQSSLLVVPVGLIITALFQNAPAKDTSSLSNSHEHDDGRTGCTCCFSRNSTKIGFDIRAVENTLQTAAPSVSLKSSGKHGETRHNSIVETDDFTECTSIHLHSISSASKQETNASINQDSNTCHTKLLPYYENLPSGSEYQNYTDQHYGDKLISEEESNKPCCEKFLPMFSKESVNEDQCRLPHVCVYVSWTLCFTVVMVSAFFTFSYSLVWGKAIAEQWLSSMLVSFTQDLFIIQPLKICVLAVFVSCFFRERTVRDIVSGPKELKQSTSTGRTVRDPVSGPKELKQASSDSGTEEEEVRVSVPDEGHLERVRQYKLKESKMFAFAREMALYLLFLLLLAIVCYGNRSYHGFAMTKAVKDDFNKFAKVSTDARYWVWLGGQFLSGIYAGKWYNGAREQREVYIANKNSILLGMPRLRQLRVKPDSCKVPEQVKVLADHCYETYSLTEEDKTPLHLPGWKSAPTNVPWENLTKLCPRPWRYSTPQELGFFPSWGFFYTYSGGGYVADLGYNINTASQVIRSLQSNTWISPRTRAVLLEFSIFNTNTNYLSSSTFYYEALPMTFGHLYQRIDSLVLYATQSWAYQFYLICMLLFILLVILYLFREIRQIYRTGRSYFLSFWNWIEVVQALAAAAVVVTHLAKEKILLSVITKLKQNPFITVSFQMAIAVQEAENVALSFAVFFATLKLLRMVRFNPHIVIFSLSLRKSKPVLVSYSAVLLIVVLAFAVLFHLVFGATLLQCSTLMQTVYFELLMAIGAKMRLEQLRESDEFLGPVIGFSFKLLMMFILMNFFIAILNDAYEDVNTNMDRVGEQFEMSDFIIERLKEILLHKKYKLGDDMGTANTMCERDQDEHIIHGHYTKGVMSDGSTSINSKTLIVSSDDRKNINDSKVEEKSLRLATTPYSATAMAPFENAYRMRRAFRNRPKKRHADVCHVRSDGGRVTRSRLFVSHVNDTREADVTLSSQARLQYNIERTGQTDHDSNVVQLEEREKQRTRLLDKLQQHGDHLTELMSALEEDNMEEKQTFLHLLNVLVSKNANKNTKPPKIETDNLITSLRFLSKIKRNRADETNERDAPGKVRDNSVNILRSSRILALLTKRALAKRSSTHGVTQSDKALVQDLLRDPETAYLSDEEILGNLLALQNSRKQVIPEHLRMRNFYRAMESLQDKISN